MRFSAFYFLSGAMFAVGAIKTTPTDNGFGFLFIGAIIVAVLGASFEAVNSRSR